MPQLLRSPLSRAMPIQPPVTHDPSERACLTELGGWSLWSTPRNDPSFTQLVQSGQLHMQLWHAEAHISVLTPSALTGGFHELWTPDIHMRICCYTHVAQKLAERGAPPLPCPGLITHFAAWFIHAPMIGLVIGQETS